MLRQLHIDNLIYKVKSMIIDDLLLSIENISFEILFNEYLKKLNKNKSLNYNLFQYFLFDEILPNCLIKIIQSKEILTIMSQIIVHVFGYNNVSLIYYLTKFENNMIISFYLQLRHSLEIANS